MLEAFIEAIKVLWARFCLEMEAVGLALVVGWIWPVGQGRA